MKILLSFVYVPLTFSLFAISFANTSNNIKVDSLLLFSGTSLDSTQINFDNRIHVIDANYFFEYRLNQFLLFYDQMEPNFFQIYKNDFDTSSLIRQWRINYDLTQYIKFQSELALKADAGVVGEFLGKAETLTTIILAILHVLKYKKGIY